MNEYLVTFLYELANFAVFTVLLAWIFIKPVRRLLDEQASRDRQASEMAKQHLAEADQLRQRLLDDRQRFSHEVEQQRESLLQESRQQAAGILAAAKQQIDHQRQQLQAETLQLQDSQVAAIADTVADVARQAVAKLLQQIEGPALENALLESVCRELQKTRYSASSHICVESATELGDPVRRQIAAACGLGDSGGNVEFRVDRSLIGGLRIKTGHGMIDNSISGLAEYAGQMIRNRVRPQA
jgi:F0F1-type ATP synthase membrane subunit b/b'